MPKQHEFIAHLKEDHNKQKEIGEKMIAATAAKQRETLRQQFWEALYPHVVGEEASIFSYLQETKEKELQELALEMLEEHAVAKYALKEFMKCDVKSDTFKAKASVLDELNRHHIEEEEKEAFKSLVKVCDAECLDALMKKYEAAEEKAKK